MSTDLEKNRSFENAEADTIGDIWLSHSRSTFSLLQLLTGIRIFPWPYSFVQGRLQFDQ